MEAIRSGKRPEKVLLQRGLQGDNFHELFQLIRQCGLPFQIVPAEKLNRVTRKNHQGVIAYISAIEYQMLDNLLPMIFESGDTPLLIMAGGITDVRNLGAIARSAECAGAHAIIIPEKGSAPVSADAIKASAGALSRIAVCKEPNLLQSLAFLQASGLKVIALDEKSGKSIYMADMTGPVVLVMGSEDKGISPALRRMADEIASIPMQGRIGSLNVSVATGIVLFEAIRQRQHAAVK